MMRLSLPALAALFALEAAAAEQVFSWRSDMWSVFGTPGTCVANAQNYQSDSLGMSWHGSDDAGIALAIFDHDVDKDPRATWRILLSGEIHVVPMSGGQKMPQSAFSFSPYADTIDDRGIAIARTIQPLPWGLVRDWMDRNVDAVLIDMPGDLKDIQADLGQQTIHQLVMCREMMRSK